MDPLLMISATLGGGAINALAGQSEQDALNKKKARMRALLEEAYITPGEIDNILSNVHRLFNNRLTSTLNSAALTSRTIANNNITKGIVAGSIRGQELTAENSIISSTMQQNQEIDMKLAELESMSTESNFLSDFLGGSISGSMLGMQIEKLLSNLKTNKNLSNSLGGIDIASGAGSK